MVFSHARIFFFGVLFYEAFYGRNVNLLKSFHDFPKGILKISVLKIENSLGTISLVLSCVKRAKLVKPPLSVNLVPITAPLFNSRRFRKVPLQAP